MNKFSIAAGFGAALVAASAFAADLPRKGTPPAPAFTRAPAFTWTGFYVGVNAGYGFGNMTGRGSGIFSDPRGFIGGGQIGYNHQINQFVLGVETDLQYSGMSEKNAASKAAIPYFGTVRARAGVAFDRFLPYVTAGYAYGGSRVTDIGAGRKSTALHHGWVVGGGVEYAFTNNLTAKIEGLYVDLGEKSVLGGTRKVGSESGIIRAGINAKF